MRGEQRKSRRFYDPIQEGKLIICEKPQVYTSIGQNAFWFVCTKSKGSVTKASRGGGEGQPRFWRHVIYGRSLSDQKSSSLSKQRAWWCKIIHEYIKTYLSKKKYEPWVLNSGLSEIQSCHPGTGMTWQYIQQPKCSVKFRKRYDFFTKSNLTSS